MAEPTTTPSQTSLSTSFTPTGTRDSAPGSQSSSSSSNNGSSGVPMASYYFVFLMLTLCVVAVVIFLNFRRRRKRRMQLLNGYGGRDDAWQRSTEGGAGGANGRGRRYWQGRWGSTNVSREEGLNEHGEAPPPYVPKRPEEVVVSEGGSGSAGMAPGGGPAVPMQTLRREDVGLKPPDYEEDMMRPTRGPEAGGSSSSPRAERREEL